MDLTMHGEQLSDPWAVLPYDMERVARESLLDGLTVSTAFARNAYRSRHAVVVEVLLRFGDFVWSCLGYCCSVHFASAQV